MGAQHKRMDDRTDDVQMRRSTNGPHLRLAEGQIRAIYQFIYRHVGNRSDAESLTERACSEVVRDGRGLAHDHDAQSLDDLLWQVAYRVVSEHLRWFYGSSEAIVAAPPGDEQTDAPALARDVLERLSAQERAFLSYRFLANASLDEAAAALDMAPSDALALQWRALLQAARILQPETTCSTC